jgi:hypothetical protein
VIFYFNSYPSTLPSKECNIFAPCCLRLSSTSTLIFLSFASEHTDTTQLASVAWAARPRGAAFSGRAQGSVQPAGAAVRTSLRRLSASRPASAYSFLRSCSQSPPISPNPPPQPQKNATAAASSSARAPRRCPGQQRSEEQAGLPAVAFHCSCEPAASLTWPRWSRAATHPSGSDPTKVEEGGSCEVTA